MALIRTIIADDEILATKRVELLLKENKRFEVIGTYNQGHEAVEKINALRPDLVFLDINFPNITGFDIVKQLEYNPIFIFVTAYDKHAIKAFDVFAFDFLVKPFKDERFFKTLNKVEEYLAEKNPGYDDKVSKLLAYLETSDNNKNNGLNLTKIPVKLGNKINLIPTTEIKYILASGYYSEIYTLKKKYVLRESITNLIKQLEHQPFARIHRSSIVNFDFIEELVYSNYGELDVKMVDHNLIRVSKGYKKTFFSKLGIQ